MSKENITRKLVRCKYCGEVTQDFDDGYCENCPPLEPVDEELSKYEELPEQ
jgi:hypothetical protein